MKIIDTPILLLAISIFIIGCAQEQPSEANLSGEAQEPKTSFREEASPVQEVNVANKDGLGQPCNGIKECGTFCHDSRGLCEGYCQNNPDNEMCQRLGFAAGPSESNGVFSERAEASPEKSESCAVIFDYPPVNLEKITHIEPMGSVHGEHVAPIDHQYYQNFNNDQPTIEVYAPGDGVVREIQHMGSFKGDVQREPFDDYRLIIEHSCTISSVFIHIDKLSDKIKKAAPAFGQYTGADVPVQAGEIIGWFDTNVDYNVVDKAITINLIEPKSYSWHQDRIHIQDPFLYFNNQLQQKLIAKSLRTAKPEGGLIDYDKDGTLLGTWFREGTNGWEGLRQERYWADHLSVIYDSIDPDHVIFSIGTIKGTAQQFGVKGNMPDPAAVTPKIGMVKYELVPYRLYDGEREWDFKSMVKGLKAKNSERVEGVVLVQMLEDRKVKVEVFPDAVTAHGFTGNAQIYVR